MFIINCILSASPLHFKWSVNTRKLVSSLYPLNYTSHLKLAHFLFEQCDSQLKWCFVTCQRTPPISCIANTPSQSKQLFFLSFPEVRTKLAKSAFMYLVLLYYRNIELKKELVSLGKCKVQNSVKSWFKSFVAFSCVACDPWNLPYHNTTILVNWLNSLSK